MGNDVGRAGDVDDDDGDDDDVTPSHAMSRVSDRQTNRSKLLTFPLTTVKPVAPW
jgi:hypothetical protein